MAPDVRFEAAMSWSLVVPVKVLARAKSRITGLAGRRRSELVLAMAADTVAAALGAESVAAVLVVTDDPDVSRLASGLGALVLPDIPASGLNEALAHGAAHAQQKWPERGLAGLAADLPAARPRELTAALAAAARLGEAFMPDADGTGTTMYAAAPGWRFRPQFGVGSRARHRAVGAVEIGPAEIEATCPGGNGVAAADSALSGLRRDVDTIEDLREAARLGLGPRTLALLTGDSAFLR